MYNNDDNDVESDNEQQFGKDSVKLAPIIPPIRRRFTIFVRSIPGAFLDDPRRAASEIRAAEDFINQQPDVSFQVIKIFPWNKKRERILRLTSTGIENIRTNHMVSSVHSYSAVASVTLKDIETLIISYDGEHDYVYRSVIAMEIAQELSCRLAIRRTTEKKKLNYDIALKYQEKLRHHQQQENVWVRKVEGKRREQYHSIFPPTFSKHSSGDHRFVSTTSNGGSDHNNNNNNNNNNNYNINDDHEKSVRAQKLVTLTGTTEQQRLETAVLKVLMGNSPQESKMVREFQKNFHVLLKNPATAPSRVRQFMDGLREFVLEHHETELEKLLIEAKVSSFKPDELSLASVIERCIQKVVVWPLQDKLLAAIEKVTKKQDALIHQKKAVLRQKSQSSFGIPKEFVDFNTDWSSAIIELNFMDRYDIPQDKLGAILAAAKTIYNTVSFHRNACGVATGFLSADDFLPIFIYVVTNCELTRMETMAEYLYALNDPDQLNGESGYYLTVFMSALTFIKNVNPDELDIVTHPSFNNTLEQNSFLLTGNRQRSTALSIVKEEEEENNVNSSGSSSGGWSSSTPPYTQSPAGEDKMATHRNV